MDSDKDNVKIVCAAAFYVMSSRQALINAIKKEKTQKKDDIG